MAETHLTAQERVKRTEVQWHDYDTIVTLINWQNFERTQQKYLKLRDVMALRKYN